MDTTTGMSAPPIAITMWMPNSSATTVMTIEGHHGRPHGVCGMQEGIAKPDHDQQTGQIQPVAARQQQGAAADAAGQLAEAP